MSDKKAKRLFNVIAPIYGWFYKSQKKKYQEVIDKMHDSIKVVDYKTAIDIGCGTGALCSVLAENGLTVTGVDQAEKMLDVAKKKTKGQPITFIEADVTSDTLMFDSKSFDLAFTTFVAHGMDETMRKKLYTEMCRLAKEWVIIHDYNNTRKWYISTVEWFEGGDYVNFIENAEAELKGYMEELESCFDQVQVVEVSPRANWYICKPKSK